jgi:hypothetical protein
MSRIGQEKDFNEYVNEAANLIFANGSSVMAELANPETPIISE